MPKDSIRTRVVTFDTAKHFIIPVKTPGAHQNVCDSLFLQLQRLHLVCNLNLESSLPKQLLGQN